MTTKLDDNGVMFADGTVLDASTTAGATSLKVGGVTKATFTNGGGMEIPAATGNTEALQKQQALGQTQHWLNMTASRTYGSTYTNDTGKPIQIAVSVYFSAAAGCYQVVVVDNGVTTTFLSASSGGTNYEVGAMPIIIPPNATYTVSNNSGTGTVVYWNELR